MSLVFNGLTYKQFDTFLLWKGLSVYTLKKKKLYSKKGFSFLRSLYWVLNIKNPCVLFLFLQHHRFLRSLLENEDSFKKSYRVLRASVKSSLVKLYIISPVLLLLFFLRIFYLFLSTFDIKMRCVRMQEVP